MLKIFFNTIRLFLCVTFIVTSSPFTAAHAGEIVVPIMPKPGTIVNLSPMYNPAFLNGVVIHPDNALEFDFLIHKGQGNLNGNEKNEEYTKLVKYFLASLTIPDEDQWVNLSPYETDLIIFLPMAWGNMDNPRPINIGDIICRHNRTVLLLTKRMRINRFN